MLTGRVGRIKFKNFNVNVYKLQSKCIHFLFVWYNECIGEKNMKNLILYNDKFESKSKEIVEVDLSKCKNDTDIFNVFKVAFQFPEWFGENWNAFDDCMTNLCFDVKDALVVKIYGFEKVFKLSKEYANYILDDLIVLAKGEASQDSGNSLNAIIYLYEVSEACEETVKEKGCNFIIQ